MTGAARVSAWVLAAALSAAPVPAQQFDNFDEGSGFGDGVDLDTFDFGTLPDADAVPGLGDGDTLPLDDGGVMLDLSPRDDATDGAIITFPGTRAPVTSVQQPPTAQGARAILRALDKTLGRPTDVDLAVGETVVFGRIAIRLVECRFPAEDPSSDAFARLEIYDLEGNALFAGWMVASSPALSALEHPRYDVWVLDCAA